MPTTPPMPPPCSPPNRDTEGVPTAADPDPAQAASRRRRAASLVSALGASLVLIAAATFISLRWEEMALLAKSGMLAGLAGACLVVGVTMRDRVPGTASALVHLGAFMAALDAGAIATYAGFGFGWTAAAGGIAGLVSTAAFPAVLATIASDRRLERSPVMEVGRVLALAALGLAVANTTPLAATLVVASAAIAAALLERREATGLALVAGFGPVIDWIGSRAEAGSLLRWLADMTSTTPLTTAAVGVVAIAAISALRRGPFWSAAAAVVGAIATPSAVEVFGQHQNGSLIAAAAAVVGFRLVAKAGDRTGWLPLIDLLAITSATVGFLVGSFRFLASVIVDGNVSRPVDLGLAVTAGLLGVGWLLSDLLTDEGPIIGRLWCGATGPIATLGIASAALVGATSSMQFDRAGAVVTVAGLTLGVTRRKGAVLALRIGLPIAAILLLDAPVLSLVAVIAGALTSQFRAHRDLADGTPPARASLTQLAGLVGLGIGSLATVDRWSDQPGNAVLAALAIGGALVLIGMDSSRLRVRDLALAPRLALPLALAPVWFDLGLAGGVAIALALVFLADGLALRTQGSEWLAPMHLTAGMWLIANDPWWQSTPITSADWWLFGPSVLVGVVGWHELRAGSSSWQGFGPAFGIIGSVALFERLLGGGGGHGAVAGGVGLVAILLGVERRWSSPTVIGACLLGAAISIEVGGVVPRIPVWALLSVGGVLLLGFGLLLERHAGHGPMASWRSTWGEFR